MIESGAPTTAKPPWLRRTLGPPLSLKELNLICWGLFLVFLVLPLGVIVKARQQSGQPLLQNPEVDFIYLYSMGRILNTHPAAELYDFAVQKQVCTEVHPLKTGGYGPIPYHPYVGILFRPFALMPYTSAYLLWVSISFLLYMAGLILISGRFFPHDPLRRSLVFCFALSFYPFVNWTLLSGHISTIGFLAVALAFREEDRGRSFLSGLALSLCLYKPPLLVLLLPMLVVTRRLRTLLGFASGVLALALFATAVEGIHVWKGYIELLTSFGRSSAAVQSHSFRQLWKYIDIGSLVASLRGGSRIVPIVVLAGACWAGFEILRAWWTSGQRGKPANTLIWAATITWTLVLNVYVPIYDSILVVLSVIATVGTLRHFPEKGLYWRYTMVWLSIFWAAWFTVGIAEATGFQILTVLLVILGVLQLAALRKVNTVHLGGATP